MTTHDGSDRPVAVGVFRSALLSDPKHGWLPTLMLVMTVLSGMLDAISILSLGHVFVANMTGNLAFSGFALTGAPGFSLTATLSALAAFCVGVVLWRLVPFSRAEARLVLVRNAFVFETVLFVAAAITYFAVGEHPGDTARPIIAAICAIAMGIQNSLVGRLQVVELTTTVMTKALAGVLINWGTPGNGPAVVRQAMSVVALVIGAMIGALLVLRVHPGAAVSCVAAIAAVITVSAAVGATRRPV
jgi:uncharacterized membrane protein YoaK (UPF0700 family)